MSEGPMRDGPMSEGPMRDGPMSEGKTISGRPASPGLAVGRLVRLSSPDASLTSAAGPDVIDGHAAASAPTDEAVRLATAIEAARLELEAVAAAQDDLAAEILAFQIEMLGDPALAEDAFAAIAEGVAALPAWQAVMTAQITGFEASEDVHFKARASDLRDLSERVSGHLSGSARMLGATLDGILLAEDLTPSQLLELDTSRIRGVVLEAGSARSHMAMLARARALPMLVETRVPAEAEGREVLIDGGHGLVMLEPDESMRLLASTANRKPLPPRERPLVTASGLTLSLMVNVDDPRAIDDEVLARSDGVGLMRTEFLFIGRAHPPDEDEQLHAYRSMIERLEGRPLIVRTIDIGGDKPLPYLHLPAEANPFLGLRGLRLALQRPDLQKTQLRALMRAGGQAELSIMVPMVTTPVELLHIRALMEVAAAELRQEGHAHAVPPLGMMVETPVSALRPADFDVAFYSIGTNDLTQYVMAAARDATGPVADLVDPLDPAVLELIGRVVSIGTELGRTVSICGDVASDPKAVPALLKTGCRRFSVAAGMLLEVEAAACAL